MRHRLVLIAAAAVAAPAGAAAGAGPPTIRTALPCYLPDQTVRLTGSGFHAADRYSVTLDRDLLGTGTVHPGGTISGRLSSGKVPAGAHRVLHRILVADGALQARVGFHTTTFGASFSPSTGDPHTLKVRYFVDAIGLAAPGGSLVWLHYLDPIGRVRRSVAIGRTRGVCGSLRRSIPHRLFPVRLRRGVWRLQFDLKQGYSAATRPRIVRAVAVGQ
jgi:hypothetical protein